jgi:hypothetical protein
MLDYSAFLFLSRRHFFLTISHVRSFVLAINL